MCTSMMFRVRRICRGACSAAKALEDNAAAHGCYLTSAPVSVPLDMRNGQVCGRWEEVKSSDHRDDVAVMHADDAR